MRADDFMTARQVELLDCWAATPRQICQAAARTMGVSATSFHAALGCAIRNVPDIPMLVERWPALAGKITKRAAAAGMDVEAVAQAPELPGIMEALRDFGAPRRIENAIGKRVEALRGGGDGFMQGVVMTDKELLTAVQKKLSSAVGYIDDFAMASAAPKDLVVMVKELFSIERTLQGLPSTIIDHAERKKIRDLLPAILKEAARRGIAIPMEREVNPEVLEHEEAGYDSAAI